MKSRLLTYTMLTASIVALGGCGNSFQSAGSAPGEQATSFSSESLSFMPMSKLQGWDSNSLANKKFSVSFSATPMKSNQDTVIGLSQNQPSGYTDVATLARFNESGTIDVRNADRYSALKSVPYSANSVYRFRMDVDVAAHTYNVSVTPPGGSAVVLATNAKFRSEQAAIQALNYFVSYSDVGSVKVTEIMVSYSLPDITPPMDPPTTTPPTTNPPPVTPVIGDGSANAPACAIPRPTLLSTYKKRPTWQVAGVDYCVGYPSNTVLKDPSTIKMTGVSVDQSGRTININGNNITLDGYDFNGWQVIANGANDRIVNSKFFVGGSHASALFGSSTSKNLYIGYSVIDGGSNVNNSTLIEFRGSVGIVVEYNWMKNSGGDMMQMHSEGDLTMRYNLIENAGLAPGAHGDYTQFIGGPFTATINYNTTYQGGNGSTQGFMIEPDFGQWAGVVTGAEIANNTMVNKGGLSYCVAVTVPDLVNSFTVHDNFYDVSGGYGFSIGGVRGGPGDSSNKTSYISNVNMVTGVTLAGP